MNRDPTKRLGYLEDVNEIIRHPFFAEVDFHKLEQKLIEPPYKPSAEQMTLKEEELLTNNVELKEIQDEDKIDDIPVDKKVLINLNQNKFKDF